MKVIIVAAGMATRLRKITNGTPKPLLKIGDYTLIERSINYLKYYGYGPIAVVTGYKRNNFKHHLNDKVDFIFNPWYETTNNMASLWFARHWVGNEPYAYLHADLLYHPEIIKRMAVHKNDTVMLYDSSSIGEEEMKVKVKDRYFVCSDKSIQLNEADGEWLGINQFSAEHGKCFFDTIESILEEGILNKYDTFALTKMAVDGVKMPIEDIAGLPWLEIDFPEDFERAQNEILPLIEKM